MIVSPALRRRLNQVALIERDQVDEHGHVDGATTILDAAPSTVLYPANPSQLKAAGLSLDIVAFAIYLEDDRQTRNGDLITIDGTRYVVRLAQGWPNAVSSNFSELIVESHRDV
ncbi:MAG: hypothetical protein M9928_15620 [Anaerolineae bacterium]|nr:hypothetical protein [Anaerolineae bacterium]MCO5194558.1 hypothetical protein [Anaerolineae bacterium]MCO5199631.1 hypothetical protein [Anaerolineae bacterium]MCO5206465.1 hypothetical protein [Anaerolineae bacterium]